MYSFTTPLFFILSKGLWNKQVHLELSALNRNQVPIWAIAIFFGSIVFLWLVVFHNDLRYRPTPKMFFLLVSIVASIAWINLIIGMVIDVIQLLQTLTGLPTLVLGMTIMAIGNSCPDAAVDPALSAQGYTTMAITGVYSGQMFNFLVGTSISCIFKSIG